MRKGDIIPSMKIATDDHGDVILCPVTDWATAFAGRTGILLAVRFEYRTPDNENHDSAVQLLLTASQCTMLGEQLTGRAKEFLVSHPPS